MIRKSSREIVIFGLNTLLDSFVMPQGVSSVMYSGTCKIIRLQICVCNMCTCVMQCTSLFSLWFECFNDNLKLHFVRLRSIIL